MAWQLFHREAPAPLPKLPRFHPGETVEIRDAASGKWTRATVTRRWPVLLVNETEKLYARGFIYKVEKEIDGQLCTGRFDSDHVRAPMARQPRRFNAWCKKHRHQCHGNQADCIRYE